MLQTHCRSERDISHHIWTRRHVQPSLGRSSATYLHAEAVLLNVGQSDAPVVGIRLLHQERLLALVLLHVVVGGGADHRRLDGCGARSAVRGDKCGAAERLPATVPLRWGGACRR